MRTLSVLLLVLGLGASGPPEKAFRDITQESGIGDGALDLHVGSHYGLGDRESVDASVVFHPSGKRVEKKGVKADGVVLVEE